MRVALACAVISAVFGPRATACDFCLGGGQDFRSLQSEVEGNRTVALARVTGRGADGLSSFRIGKILKGGAGLRVGDQVSMEAAPFTLPRASFLLVGKESKNVAGGRAVAVTSSSAAWVERLLRIPPPEGKAERLLYFLPYLGNPEPLIAASARQEFVAAPYSNVKALKPYLRPAELLAQIESAKTPRASRGPLVLMLGVCGSATELPKFEAWLADPAWQREPGYDAAIASYLLLRGSDGLPLVRKRVEGTDAASRSRAVSAFLNALRFHEREEKVLPRARIVESVRDLLQHTAALEATVTELTRLKDWDGLQPVLKAYARSNRNPRLERAVRKYLRACPGADSAAALAALD